MNKKVTCSKCGGSGFISHLEQDSVWSVTCKHCNGRGKTFMSNKEKILAYIKTFEDEDIQHRRIEYSENWYNPYYAIKETFDREEIEAMTETEVDNLIKIVFGVAEGLNF